MTTNNNKTGFRGYVSSRPIGDHRVPQHIQNIIIRSYAKKYGLLFLLSGTEYKMNETFLMLRQMLDESDLIEGIIFYSMFMLPSDKEKRVDILKKALDSDMVVCFAVEDVRMVDEKDMARCEDLFQLVAAITKIDYVGITKWLT